MSPLSQAQGSSFTRILSLGAARGDLVVSNDDIAGPIDSSDEWIRQRTGIIERRRSSDAEEAIDLAVRASNEAIEKAGIRPDQIDAVIVATISNSVQTPSLAALLADRVGATPAAAYDISAAGFPLLLKRGRRTCLPQTGPSSTPETLSCQFLG